VAYIAVRCALPEGRDDDLAETLSEYPVLGAHIQSLGPGLASAVVYASASEAERIKGLAQALVRLGGTDVTVDCLAERDWLDEYRRTARPFAVGARWWVEPDPGSASSPSGGRVALVIEPSAAFGSGSHESTQLVLLRLEDLNLEGRRVLDVGTGSGILAVASRRLGAEHVIGIDLDPRAVFVARRTLDAQVPPVSVPLVVGSLDTIGRGAFDVVLCNMLWEALQALLPDLGRLLAPDGVLVLSGFLGADEESVRACLIHVGLVAGGRCELGEWLSLEVRHG
jgi:ribosomal protein L11 methyltransferase